MTDAERFDWLMRHCVYIEHHPQIKDAFWPHYRTDGTAIFTEEYEHLTLREYIDARVQEGLE